MTGTDPMTSDHPPCDETLVREALRDAALGLDPPPWPAGAVRERARRRLRARRLAVALPVAAAVAAGVAVVANGLGVPPTAVRMGPPATGPTAATPSPSPSPSVSWPAVRVVQPGQIVPLGDGQRMKLESDQRCEDQGEGVWTCKSVVDGNQEAGSVSLQSEGDAKGTLFTPLYIGSGHPTRMTVAYRGHTYPAHVVTLPGDPGYATGYVWGVPVRGIQGFNEVIVRVYDAHGRRLASFVPPGAGGCLRADRSAGDPCHPSGS